MRDEPGGAPGRWIGTPVPRLEDPAFLVGASEFVDDIRRPGMLHAVFVRSPFAAARIAGISAGPALEVPGVHSLITAADLREVTGLRAVLERPEFRSTEMPLLARDAVRHVGEPVAMVLAESPYAAEDGAEATVIDFEPLPSVVSIEDALREGAPAVHGDVPDNLLLDVTMYEDPELDTILAEAPHLVSATFTTGRVTAAPMEGRASLADWDRREGRIVLYVSHQIPHLVRTTVADSLGFPEHRIRVVTPSVGGGFGLKCVVGREEILVSAAALRLRRPVKWIESRQENLASSFHGHEQRYRVRSAFDHDGVLLGLEADIACDVGAYACYPFTCGVEPLMAAGEMPGPYRLRRYRARARAVATNKAPIAPYRGVSRPQITLVMERLMDKAARLVGIDAVEIRRRNLIADQEFPYTGVTGLVYDRGSYRESLELCSRTLAQATWRKRQEAARGEGRLIGLGFSCFSERTAYGTPAFASRKMRITPGYERADIRMDPSGGVTVSVGTLSHGQGHRTTLAQIVADELGVEPAMIRVAQGDTDIAPYGWGTFASRSVAIGGGAAKRAAAALAERLRRLGAHLLEAAPEDVELRDGRVCLRGAPGTGIGVEEVARVAHHAVHRLPEGEEGGLQASATFDPPGTFSNATHGTIVEVSPETGEVRIGRYVVVEDCGVVVNPMIVDGQIHGGVAQGIGAALYEQLLYDVDGQLLTTTLMDYLVPTAAEIPPFEVHHLQTPSEFSETGAKGMGEGGMIGAPAAIANAVNDALAHLGVEIETLPITPERVLAAIRAAGGGGAGTERGVGEP
ncbi:MAG: xanthine dehydrogenase family protein molybdopterin-binding subunit [Actinobacteria bacterium]|nr:xanthine dehydrogenase family protein molybdopterin-binding subunit [Actinomycetota bacterium]